MKHYKYLYYNLHYQLLISNEERFNYHNQMIRIKHDLHNQSKSNSYCIKLYLSNMIYHIIIHQD